MSFTRKKDKKVELSFTNWVLGGSLVSLTSTDLDRRRASSKRVFITEVNPNDEAILIKSPPIQKTDKKEKEKPKENDKNDSKDEKKEKSKDDEKKAEKCTKCGKKINPCKEGCKGRVCSNASEQKSKAKGDEKKDRGEKSDGEKGEKSEESGGGGSGWTEEQDRKIREMKAENKSWKDIALEVGASKKDVQNRFKELMKNGDGGGGEKKKDDNGWENGGGWNEGVEMSGGNENMPDFGELFVDDIEEGGGGEQGGARNSWENNNNKSGNNGGKKNKNKGNKQQNGSNNHSGGRSGKQDSGNGFDNPFDYPPEQAASGKLQPNGAWTQNDCEILEYLKDKYEENKWLHMQAGFYNWTGRMVIAQLIEQKFKDDGAA